MARLGKQKKIAKKSWRQVSRGTVGISRSQVSRRSLHSTTRLKRRWESLGITRVFRTFVMFTLHNRFRQLSTRVVVFAAVVLVASAFFVYVEKYILAVSDSYTVTTQADWEAGEYYNNTLDTTTTTDAVQIRSGGVGSWDASTPALPENTRGYFPLAAQVPAAGADLTSDGSYLYLIFGNNLPDFWRYNPDTNTWKQLADAPTAFSINSAITYYNGFIYAINGHDGTVTTDATGEFYKYNVAIDEWTKLDNAPDAWGTVAGPGGADIESSGNGKIYAIQGNAQTGFWQFDTVTEEWTSSPDGVFNPILDPVTAANSHPLVFSDKSFVVSGTTYCSSGCLYVTLGGSVNFYRYDIANTQWYGTGAAPLTPQIPAALGSATTGSALVEDPDNDVFYAFRGGNTEFMRYRIGDGAELVAGAWDTQSATPCVDPATCTENTQRNVAAGSSLAWIKVNGSGYVYGLLGGVAELVRYDITAGKWGMIITPAGQGTNANDLVTYVPNGADCSDSEGCLFVATPATANLRRYDLSTSTWTSMTNLSLTLGAGADLCYDGAGQLFILQGGTVSILVHNIAAGGAGTNGTTLSAPAAFGAGASITCMSDNRFYAMRGGSQVNYYYSAAGANPVADDSINTNGLPYLAASYGGALINDGTYVYALIGNGRGVFLRFDPSQASGSRWTEMATLPTATSTAAQTYTSALGYDGSGNIYAIAGHYQKDFWRYDIDAGAKGTWTHAADLPVRMVQSMGITNATAGGAMYVLRGSGNVGVSKFNRTAGAYVSTATWVSAPLDLDFVSDFTTFAATHPTPGTSSISFAVRSSTNKVDWSAWENIISAATSDSTSFDMASVTTPNRRYVQVKVVLTSDGTNTPTLSDLTITYEKDSSAPSNPTVMAYADSTKATPLADTGSYFYTNPYFEFTSPSQTESPISGYYAAWTSEANFDPSNTGLYGEDYFQTGSTYLVRRPMTRTGAGTIWYMRIAAKDQAGNVAAVQTKFQYTYTGINDASIKTWTTEGEFTGAGTVLSNVEGTSSSGNVKLTSVTNGAWTTESALPATASNGAMVNYVSGNQNLYITRGTNTSTFWSYNTVTKLFTALAAYGGGNIGVGASSINMAPNGTSCIDTVGCLFISQGRPGANALGFYRYNIGGSASVSYAAGVCGGGSATTANTWTACTSLPAGATSWNSGGSLAYNEADTIYALVGNGQLTYRYSLANNAWTLMSNVDNAVGVGGTLIWTPNGTGCTTAGGCLYATRGASTTHFYKGTISSLNGSVSWTYGRNTPLTMGDGGAARRISNKIYYIRGGPSSSPSNSFNVYDLTTGLWAHLADTPTNQYQGSEHGLAYNSDTNYLYTLRGYSETSIFAYDISRDNWKRTPSIPSFYTSNGFSAGAVAYDSAAGLMYVARGNGVTDFWSYNFSTNVWRQLADVPHTVTTGADAEYINHTNNALDGVYLLAGAEGLNDNITYFYRYSPSTDTWAQLSYKTGVPANIPEVGAGADLVFDGTDNIYTAQGGTTAFFNYDITSDVWSNLTGANQTLWAANGSGSCAVKINVGGTNYIYLARANSQANVYRFNIGTQVWEASGTVENAPGVLVAGDACVLDGPDDGTAKLLIPQGTTNTNMYVLDPDGDGNGVWTTRTVPQVYSNGSLVQGATNTIIGFRGGSTGSVDRYVVSSAGVSGYEQNGTWTSEIVDFNGGQTIGVAGYAGLQVTLTDATDTYETVETRTCNNVGCAADTNNVNWSAWTATTNQRTLGGVDYYSVASTVARYGQVRIRLTSDQVLTPTIQDVQWSYYVDSTVPNNPTAPVNGYTSSAKTTPITNDTWTNDLTPYFEWTSTDDTNGIGIEGYYVYFGNNASKDPVSDANDPTNLAYTSGTNYYLASGSSSTGSWNAQTQAASPLTDGTYYLRIKTKDRNGNVTASAVAAFTYKVDGTAPNAITDLSVATYMLATDTFSFSWTEPADVGPSGISQYCYHTGVSADTCVARATICSGSTCTVSPVAHYQNRVNTFYVLAKDAANNSAASYASTGYFYTGGPPAAPASVTVTPGSQTDTNNFTVTWTLPSSCLGQTPCSASDILRYCYTINELPNSGNCGTNFSGTPTPSPDGGWTTDIQASSRQLASFSAATLQGTNTVYIVAMDVVSNINYSNATSQTFTFTSNAPGVPSGLSSTDSSDRAANRYSITLTWDEPDDVGSGVEGYKVYRCTTGCANPDTVDDPPANYTHIATVNTLGYLDTSLSNTTTYTYFVRATGTGSTISGNSAVVSMKPEGKFKAPPAMSGNPTTSIRIRSAEISWLTQDDVDSNGDPVAHPASSYVQYGTTTAYGSETGSSDLVKEHEVTLTGLAPNTLYHYRLKWVDVDGNQGLSGDYSFTTLGAPSAPTGVTATPSSGSTNSFAFAWTAPADEGVTVASYRYSVNSTPTADNTVTTTLTSVPAYAAATRQGSNTFYIVAVDDGGNVNYANYGSVDFTANTQPPSPPQNITITDSSDRDAKRYSITLTWDASTVSGTAKATAGQYRAQAVNDATIYYTISRSTDGITFSDIATITSTGYLDTGLDSSTTYYYKVTAQDKAQATSDPTKTVSDTPEGRFTQPPAITEDPASTPDSYSATITWKTERVASSFVDFGPSATQLTEEQGTADLVTDHSVKVSGLSPETTYYYKVKSLDVDENEAFSEVDSFTTLEAPKVSAVEVTDIRLFDATITWTTNKEATSLIQYGATTEYGLTWSDTSESYAFTHTVKLENLKDSSQYHFRIGGQDRSGNPITSDDYSFVTQTFPKASDITSKNKSEGQTEIFWKTNVPTTSSVEYYADNIAPKTQGNTALVTDHVILLYGLEDATLYKFKVHGADEYGYEAVSDELEFTTLEDTTPPEVYGVTSESNTIGSGESSKIQIVVSWKTNEPTSSKVEFGVGLSSTEFSDETEENAELVMDHLVVISELTPAKTYHFRVVSRDKAGNETKSGSYTVLTSRKRESFLQLIITNLEETFSWLGNIGSTFN